MKSFYWLGMVLVIAVAAIMLNSFYVVRQDKQALVLAFGAAIETKNMQGTDEAGLHYKHFWHSVDFLDKRNLGYSLPEMEIVAADQRRLRVDAFVRWRIVDPLKFYSRLRNERVAGERLETFVEPAIKNAMGKLDVPAIVSGQRSQLMDNVRQQVNKDMLDFGVDIIDLRIRQADFPNAIAQSVFKRMKTSRTQEAQLKRSEGEEEARLIRATAEKERVVIEAKAREQSEVLRGKADAKRNAIYAAAYNKDTEFFSFYRGLVACENALTKGSRTQLVIAPSDIGICDQFISAARRASR